MSGPCSRSFPSASRPLLKRHDASQELGFEELEHELHALFTHAECAATSEALERHDVDLPHVFIDAEKHHRAYRCEKTYLCAVGPVTAMRTLYRARPPSDRTPACDGLSRCRRPGASRSTSTASSRFGSSTSPPEKRPRGARSAAWRIGRTTGSRLAGTRSPEDERVAGEHLARDVAAWRVQASPLRDSQPEGAGGDLGRRRRRIADVVDEAQEMRNGGRDRELAVEQLGVEQCNRVRIAIANRALDEALEDTGEAGNTARPRLRGTGKETSKTLEHREVGNRRWRRGATPTDCRRRTRARRGARGSARRP